MIWLNNPRRLLNQAYQKEKRDKKEKNKKTEENKKENKKENELSEPKLAIDSWLGSKNLLELKEVLYEAINAAKEFASRGDAKKMVRGFLKDIGGGQVFNIAFIVVANAWERYEDMSKSEEACLFLSLLEEINKFAKIVIDLQKVLQNDPESKKRMEDLVNEAIELIIETSIACCTQIEASKKSRYRYWGTTGGGGELTKLEKQLDQTYTRIQLIMEAAKELDKENIDGDFSDLINYISRLFDFIEGSLHGMKAQRGKDSIFEIGSSSRPPGDNIFESGASSSPNVSEVGSAVAAVEIETVDVNLSELSNYVSQLLNFRKGNEPLKPRGPKYFLPDSKRFFKLKEFLSEGTNAVEGFIRGERKTFIGHFLEGMEMPHMVATGFLVQANVLERYESISTNKEACLSLLNEMHTLAQDVKELSTEPALEEAMKVSIREATTLIVEASLACCTQIDASKFAGFFLSTPGMEELAEFEKELQKMDTHVRNQMDLCLFDAVRQPKSHSAKYPKYAGIEKPVRIKELLQEVIELLEWQSYKNAVAVILHGIGGMGKTTLADAVFARLFKEKKEECKFCFVRLFQGIKSTPNVIELQKSILRKLKGEEPEEIRSYEEGQKQIALMLEKEEAFIYIDHVLLEDKREQGPDALRQLLPENMANAKKLRLLITSRNKDAASWMTMSKGVEKKIYQIQSLPKAEAETFLKKELNGNEIQLNASQIDGIVKICGGVQALLKVLAGFINDGEGALLKVLAGFINDGEGSAVQNYETLMREVKEKNWKGNIGESIEQYVSDYDKLQDAYDKLEDKLKDTFLDVSSFFRGWDWKELSDIVGETELETLEKRRLVTRDVKSMTARVHGEKHDCKGTRCQLGSWSLEDRRKQIQINHCN